MTENSVLSPNAGPITLGDVRAALGEGDAFSTNAARLRLTLGRGSNATIQKHLDAIRVERQAAAMPVERGVTPPAPVDVVATLWNIAYVTAEATLRLRMESVTAQRDSLLQTERAARADAAAFAEQADGMKAQLDQAEKALFGHQANIAAAETVRKAFSDQIDRDKQAHEGIVAAMKAGHELERRDAATTIATLQNTIDRTAQREAELRLQLVEQGRRNAELVESLTALAQRPAV